MIDKYMVIKENKGIPEIRFKTKEIRDAKKYNGVFAGVLKEVDFVA